MTDDLNAKLQNARCRVLERQELQRRLPGIREALSAQANRAQMLEYELQQVEEHLEALESFTLTSLIESLLGRKEKRCTEDRDEASSLRRELEESSDAMANLEMQVTELEQQIEQLADAEESYLSLFEEKEARIMSQPSEPAERLAELTETMTTAKAQQHKVASAIQIGQHVLERLYTMSRAAGRARNKGISPIQVGVLVARATNVVINQSARGLVNRAGEGLEEFADAIISLDLTSGTHSDDELARLGPVIAGSCGELTLGQAVRDSHTAAPFLDCVQEAIGHLKDKSKQLQEQVREMEEQRRTVIENA